MVAGRWQVTNHTHPAAARAAAHFEDAMKQLWG
jgi:hypothetical protein